MQKKLEKIIIRHLEKVLEFNPFKNFPGIKTNEDFIKLFRSDPAFSPFYLARKKYVIARFGGNLITSLHRKLGDLYEDLTKEIISYTLGIPRSSLEYSLKLKINNQIQKRSTDGRILTDEIKDTNLKNKFKSIVPIDMKGIALEVRSCYQIGDSKRIQADRDMALALRDISLEPVMLIYCTTSLRWPISRLKKYWNLKEGKRSFRYLQDITGFDLYSFLLDNEKLIKTKMEEIFNIF